MLQRPGGAILFILGWLLPACGEDVPLHEQGVREMLLADPGEVARQPWKARVQMAARLDYERSQGPEQPPVMISAGAMAAEQLVATVDKLRDEAFVVAHYTRQAAQVAARGIADSTADGPSLPPLQGWAAASETAVLEQRALAGHAGAIVRALLHATAAQRLVRVSSWPVGAAAIGDTVYVNAAWLVALSVFDPAELKAGTAQAAELGSVLQAYQTSVTARDLPSAGRPLETRDFDDSLDGGTADAGSGSTRPLPPERVYSRSSCDSCSGAELGAACSSCSSCDSGDCGSEDCDSEDCDSEDCDSEDCDSEDCGDVDCAMAKPGPLKSGQLRVSTWLSLPLWLLVRRRRRP